MYSKINSSQSWKLLVYSLNDASRYISCHAIYYCEPTSNQHRVNVAIYCVFFGGRWRPVLSLWWLIYSSNPCSVKWDRANLCTPHWVTQPNPPTSLTLAWHSTDVGTAHLSVFWLCVGWPGPGHATTAECLVPIHWVLWSNSKSHPMVYYVHHAVPDLLKSWHLLVCLFNVGAASTTPSHHLTINIGPMSCLLGCLRVTIYH